MYLHSSSTERRLTYLLILLLAFGLLLAPAAYAQEDAPPAEIVNDEGGPVTITGEVSYTSPFFTMGVAAPMVILEDQTGFVDRNEGYIMPVESQTLGQITSDFYTSPFAYSIALPIEPQGSLRDVDHDGVDETGVMVFAPAYWTNTFGDPFLEERDLYGGGWSTAYASTRVSEDAETRREIVGGTFLIYAPDDQQGFPAGFGEDGLLFTDDDPIVTVPAGYTLVNLDSDPFTFDRSRNPVVNLIEPEGSALVDYSNLGYAEAFNALVDQLSNEYAFTEYKGMDWEALRSELLPRFEEAEANNDLTAYRRALRDFAWSIPDGHVSGPNIMEDFQSATAAGLGLAIRDVDDGRVIANFILPNGPAAEQGIELGAEIIAINGMPIDEAVDSAVAYSGPFSTDHVRRLQQLRYAIRFPLDSTVEITYKNPGEDDAVTATLAAVPETESFSFSSFYSGLTGFEQPVEYSLLDNAGLGYAKIYSFSDNDLLSIQLWERMIRTLNQAGVPGLIIDMRQNGGGSGFLADQMAAYFFDEPLELGNNGRYDKSLGEFFFDERTVDRFYLPAEDLRYRGKVAVLVGPNCNSACEFFAYDMSLNDRAAIVGQYPTGGLGGSIDQVLMPGGEYFTFTAGRAVDMNGDIHIEGVGVQPTVQVPVTEETLFSEGDPILDAAIDYLISATTAEITDGGAVAVGDSVSGELAADTRVRYTLDVAEGDVINIRVAAANDDLDTVLRVYDLDDNLLLANDDLGEDIRDAGFTELEIPYDLTLVLEAGSLDDVGAGEFMLTVADASMGEGASGETDVHTAGATAEPIGLASIQTDGWPLTVHEEPDTKAKALAYLANGSILSVLQVSEDGAWIQVAADALVIPGWVQVRYTDFAE
ncbi:MAG: PDZ domain-containing protein [Caldilineaceae bacterium]|nr:PDZ domain-containing protein [Caldilineaceae bacterium]